MAETGNLSRSERDDLIVMFQQFDTQQSGSISLLELKSVLEQVAREEGTKRPALDRLLASRTFQQIQDSKDDKQITQGEFIQILTNSSTEPSEEGDEMRRLFALFDIDDKGYINVNDLRRIADELGESMGEEELEEMIQRATSQEGQVTMEDFEAVMHHKLMA